MEEYNNIADLNVISESYIDKIVFKLNRQFRRINDFELLYEPEFCTDVLIDVLSRKFNNLVLSFVNQTRLLEQKWTNSDNWVDKSTGKSNNESTSHGTSNSTGNANGNTSDKQGYSGFSIENQDGDFSKNQSDYTSSNTNESSSDNNSNSKQNYESTRTDNIRYLNFFTKMLDDWGVDVVREVRNNIVRGVY